MPDVNEEILLFYAQFICEQANSVIENDRDLQDAADEGLSFLNCPGLKGLTRRAGVRLARKPVKKEMKQKSNVGWMNVRI